MILSFTGSTAKQFFQNETGGHRFQRIPPTEKRGRVQTSTVTVAVLSNTVKKPYKLDRSQVDRVYTRGTGKGGQHKNKTETVVVLTHRPTGIVVRCEDERDRHANERRAWAELERRLAEKEFNQQNENTNSIRNNQIGSGERGDKRRTYRIQDGIVKDDVSGKSISVKELYKGKVGDLHK